MTEEEEELVTLKAARAIIADPANWTKYTYARNADGISVDEMDESATCFCTLGALRKAAPAVDYPASLARSNATDELEYTLVLRKRSGTPTLCNVPGFNDRDATTHADVMALFDDTIARLSA